jgi:hypothetical protein
MAWREGVQSWMLMQFAKVTKPELGFRVSGSLWL